MTKPKLSIPAEWQAPVVRPLPEKVMEMIKLWNKCGTVRFNFDRPGTKIHSNTILALRQLIAGSFYDNKPGLTPWGDLPIPHEVFKTAVYRFRMALDEEYMPWVKTYMKKISLFQFLYNYRGENEGRSYFLWFMENEPQERNKNPRITNRLVYHYKTKLVGDEGFELPPYTLRCLTEAANFVHETFEKFRNRIYGGLRFPTPYEMADYFWQSLGDLRTFQPHYLRNGITRDKFMRYLTANSILYRSSHSQTIVGMAIPQDEDITIPPELLH